MIKRTFDIQFCFTLQLSEYGTKKAPFIADDYIEIGKKLAEVLSQFYKIQSALEQIKGEEVSNNKMKVVEDLLGGYNVASESESHISLEHNIIKSNIREQSIRINFNKKEETNKPVLATQSTSSSYSKGSTIQKPRCNLQKRVTHNRLKRVSQSRISVRLKDKIKIRNGLIKNRHCMRGDKNYKEEMMRRSNMMVMSQRIVLCTKSGSSVVMRTRPQLRSKSTFSFT